MIERGWWHPTESKNVNFEFLNGTCEAFDCNPAMTFPSADRDLLMAARVVTANGETRHINDTANGGN